ncbi:MAG: hypothetical protein ABI643_01335 [Candidatus Doudnabacteria bacterium]
MNLFSRKSNQDLIEQLAKSRQDFQFDRFGIKNKLLMSLENSPEEPVAHKFFTIRLIKYSATFAGLLIFLSTALSFASTAKPGDKLFPLNKLEEKMILNLPLSAEQKADLQVRIVSKRLEALKAVENTTNNVRLQAKQLETVKESDASIKQAVDSVSANKNALKGPGKTATEQKLDQVLNQIDDLAQKHEQRIQSLEDSASDKNIKQSLNQHLNEIKNSRHKAQNEIKSQDHRDPDHEKKSGD